MHGDCVDKDGVGLYPILLKPHSRGTVRLTTSQSESSLLINTNYLTQQADIDAIISGRGHFVCVVL